VFSWQKYLENSEDRLINRKFAENVIKMHTSFKISRLELEGLGPFKKLEITFPDKPANLEGKAEIHILTGENGTGKTTLLEVLARGVAPNSQQVLLQKIRTGIPGETHSIKVIFSSGVPFWQSGELYSHNESIEVLESQKSPGNRSIAFFAYSGYRQIEHPDMNGIQELTSNPLDYAVDFRHSVKPERILQWIANTLTKEALAKTHSDLEAAQKFRNAIATVEDLVGNIVNKKIRFTLSYEPIQVNIELDSLTLNFNLLPDGLKSIISWVSDLLMRMDRLPWKDNCPVFQRNFILFLDEIEVHLHPSWQRKILPAVQSAFPNAQIFVSTHSPFVIGSVDGAWIYKLEKPNGDSQLAKGYPILSEDAKSFRYWLEEVFDIKEQFGTDVERDMDEFYRLRDQVLQGANGQTPEKLIETARKLATQSDELNQIIQMEIRQVNRQKSLQLSL
jgi:predicted ATP-binding protein involved in virulence